jgi:DNA (cytosine-5)-methyltransferase 1
VIFGSLFSGIGGFDLGLERAGMTCTWQVENDPYCRVVLEKHWPDVPTFGDVRNFTSHTPVDLIAGGFPCQDISNAHTNGARRALNGERSGLWSEFLRIVRESRPRWVIVENVAAVERWLSGVRSDLALDGYASLPVELSAGSFGAPHKRPRVFVVAHADSESEPLSALHAEVAGIRPISGRSGPWGAPPSGGFRVADGVPRGMDRCRVLGNAVVPVVAEWLGRQIMEVAA